VTIQHLNKLYGNENLFFYTQVPRRRMPIDVALGGVVLTLEAARNGAGVNRDIRVMSKIFTHFIKGKIPFHLWK
jgi:hypothetical protein